MAELNRVSRWFVNRSNSRRSASALRGFAPFLTLPPSPRILELGAGAGALSLLLWERYRPSRLVVTDYDPVQVEAARRSLIARLGSLPEAMEIRTADALHLPFEANSFDALFALAVFHHVDAHSSEFVRRPEALREVRRVLTPGGQLVYTEILGRKEIRSCLRELGFVPVHERVGLGRDLGIHRSPELPPAGPAGTGK